MNTREEAQAEAIRLDRGLSGLGPDEWCSAIGVPVSLFRV